MRRPPRIVRVFIGALVALVANGPVVAAAGGAVANAVASSAPASESASKTNQVAPIPATAPTPAVAAEAASSPTEHVHRDLAYGPHAERNRLDLYLPATPPASPRPLVVWVHSGGWYTGGKGGGGAARALVKRGYAVAALTYRFSQDAVFPAQIEDCQRAIRWLRAHAKQYRLDPNRIGAWGGSAGGHLVALLGTAPTQFPAPADDPHRALPAGVAAVCAFNPPTDLLAWDAQALPNPSVTANLPDSMVAQLLGGPPDRLPAAARRASPIAYVSATAPPFFLVHGEADRAVPPRQSITFHAALRDAGVESTLHLIPEGGHANAAFAQGVPHEAIAAFFDRHLRPPTPINATEP